MSTQLVALKLVADAMATSLEFMMVAQQISAVLTKVHERGTPWSDADWAEVDAAQAVAKVALEASRKAAGFI